MATAEGCHPRAGTGARRACRGRAAPATASRRAGARARAAGPGPGWRSCSRGGLGLRLWGVAAGPALRLQRRRGRPLRAARGRDVRAQDLNPHYFANPPAFTYVLHYLFAVWYGGGDRRAARLRAAPRRRLHARARRRGAARHGWRCGCCTRPARGCSAAASGCSRRRSRRSRSCRSSTRTSRSTTCRRSRR